MYKLYYSPGTCALATHVVLNELDQPVEVINRASVRNFYEINPTGAVPVLHTGERHLTEGVAILLYLLEKHENNLLPRQGSQRDDVLEAMLLANATMHPAYGKLFFAANAISDPKAKSDFFEKAASSISDLWRVVDNRIGSGDFMVGNKLSPADILLTVYSAWGQFFPVKITTGKNTDRMIGRIKALESYKKAVAEQV